MPKKYHVHIRPLPPRFSHVAPFASIELEGCLGCLECVKRTSCVYDVYAKREFDPEQVVNTGDSMCVSCMRCVQECKKGIILRARNPRYARMGDEYWTSDLISRIWVQSRTGNVPVSGSGYGGRFSGPGFDSIWTDMSEIVRPTRDGIHGREYISTVIDIGRRPGRLEFDETGSLVTPLSTGIQTPIPMILDISPHGSFKDSPRRAVFEAARELGTLAVSTYDEAVQQFNEHIGHLVVKCDPERDDPAALSNAAMIELDWSAQVTVSMAEVKAVCPDAVVAVRVALDEDVAGKVSELTRDGVDVIHLAAGRDGRGGNGEFITELVRKAHLRLVEDGTRDHVTIMAGGGIAMAEHVAKTIVCGADGVGVGLAHLIALECRVCKECGPDCPVEIHDVAVEWGVQRIVNLIGSWHSQLIEVMGAMGIREVRRLRGETGRAMFFDDLERDSFAPLFGKRFRKPGFQEDGHFDIPEFASNSFALAGHTVEPCPSRYRNALSKFKVMRTPDCITCGKCAEVCAYGVHKKAGTRMLTPKAHLCRGPKLCREHGAYCADECPVGALRIGLDPMWETFGDARWPADLILGTWLQAETGHPPVRDVEYRVGESGGGFDKIDIVFPRKFPDTGCAAEDIDLRVPLNRRNDGLPDITLGIPIYGGGMSFGSISNATMVARARAWKTFDSFTCSGEGGYPDELTEYADNVITQVATGLFGVREETIQMAPIVEFKYAQGAKPGLGGHLLGDKVTPAVARIREAVPGSSLFSPFPFHSVYSVEDHKKHLDWIQQISPKSLLSVKVSTPTDVDMVAVGSYYAGAHIIHLDGSYGGTGAAPDIAKKNIAMPIEYAVPRVHQFLVEEGVRDGITLVASGGLRSAWDVAKTIALGADAVVIGTAELVSLECVRCGKCESGRGCPRGIATTDEQLTASYDSNWAAQRIINLLHSWSVQLQGTLWRLGMNNVHELVGRSDLLTHRDYTGGIE